MAKLKGGTRVYGNVKIDGGIQDSSNQLGTVGLVLTSTGTGIGWTTGGNGIAESTNTTIVSADKGKYLKVTAGVTINTSTSFSSGDVVSIYNNSASNITVTATGVTLRLAGTATTGNRTIAQRGLVTILCITTNEYVITGAGLS